MKTHEKPLPPVSIIIPALNEERYLPLLLASLTAIESEIDIIVVDGNSTDATVHIAHTFASRFTAPSSLRVIMSERGLSVQRNTGAELAQNEILLFLDADVVIPSAEIFARLISAFVDAQCVVGTSRLTPLEPSLKGYFMYWFFDMVQEIFLMFNRPYLGTYCLVTTKTLFSAIRGFDVTKPITEDIDFCFRARSQGRVIHLPVKIPVSARRFIKYGYWATFWQYVREGFIFITMGRARITKIHYPFGDY